MTPAPGRHLSLRFGLAGAIATVMMACTLINTFDAVKPHVENEASVVEASAMEAATPLPETGVMPESGPGPVDAAMEASSADASDVMVSDVVDAGPPPNKGVIVVGGTGNAYGDGGTDGGLVSILTALAPESGVELTEARENLNVASIQYDGLRDLWYVFESGGAGFFPTPTDTVFLHVRQLNPGTGHWTELRSFKVPPLVAFTLVAVLRERLLYVAYVVAADGSLGSQIVTIDTTDPSNPSIYDSQPLDQQPIGLIGTRSTTGAGGVVNLLLSTGCDGGSCLSLQHVTVPPSLTDKPAVGYVAQLGPYVGSPAYGSYVSVPEDVIGWSTKLPTVSISTFSPQVPGQTVGSPIPFSTNDGFFKPLAFAECLGQALLMGTNQDLSVYAIPLSVAAGKTARGAMTHSGQGVYFEPFTSTVLAPFSQGEGFELTAFSLTGTKDTPSLGLRQAPGWTPPADLRPELVATRAPLPVTCP